MADADGRWPAAARHTPQSRRWPGESNERMVDSLLGAGQLFRLPAGGEYWGVLGDAGGQERTRQAMASEASFSLAYATGLSSAAASMTQCLMWS